MRSVSARIGRLAAVAALPFALAVPTWADDISAYPKVTIVSEHGGRVDCGPGDLIAYDAVSPNGFYDVHVMKSDGSGDRCLTCDRPELPRNGHKGNPAWHPTGDWIVFLAEQESPGDPRLNWGNVKDGPATPGAGWRNDVWIMDAEGTKFFKLDAVKQPGQTGSLHPHFTEDGHRILWSRMVERKGSFGRWHLQLADFSVVEGVPRLSNIEFVDALPEANFHEAHGFDPTGRYILFTGDPETGHDTGLDIYRYDLQTEELTNLTGSPENWDEHAHYAASGRHIIWASSAGLSKPEPGKGFAGLKTECWVMEADGSNKTQATHFYTPGAPEYRGGRQANCQDVAWSPDGTKAAAIIQVGVQEKDLVAVIDFGKPM